MRPRSAEARLLSRVLRVGLVLVVGGQILWSFRPSTGQALSQTAEQGRTLFEASCSTCHGLQAEGTANGPSLQGSGSAAVNFMLTSGRMPLAAPEDQPMRQPPKFTDEQIDAIVAYLAEIAPGGPPIPDVDTSKGVLPDGAALFLNNCSGCHAAAGVGDSVGGGQIAPSLMPATATQIGEAARIGPGLMPVFDEDNLSEQDLNSIAAYLHWLRDNGDEGGLQLGRVGAVAEGLVAFVVGLGLLFLVVRLTGSKT
ncbi:MAG: cytochrome bc1 complex diheme cytochrome c subunit [Actinomycetota bacterium]